MSVNSKMTAIANEIRELSGSSGKMGLDAMANILNTENINLTTETTTYTNELAELQTKITALEGALEGKAVGGDGGSGSGDDITREILMGTISTYSDDKTTSLKAYAFYKCSNLTSVSFSVCTSIGDDAFRECFSLTSVNFPVCTTIGSGAFGGCSSLTSVNFQACTSIGDEAFYRCSSLTSVNFPVCTTIGSGAFRNCSSLTSVSFPVCTSIGSYAFQNCTSLSTIYLMGSKICTLSNSSAFSSTKITSTTGSIFVPTSMVDSYKSATNWTYFSNRIFGNGDAIIVPSETDTFMIDGVEYQFEEGMTWGEWIDSRYNIGGYKISYGGVYTNDDMSSVQWEEDGINQDVLSESAIIENYAYILY